MTRITLSPLAAILALPALAAEPELCRTVALHPVVVNGADTGTDRAMISEIQAIAAAELLKRQRTLQDSSIVSEALSKLPNRECSDNECLSKLARDTRSDCTAYFAVTPNAGRSVFLSARLIPASDADRPVFSRSEHYDRIGKTPKEWSISALQRFIRTVPLAKDSAPIEPLSLVPQSDGPPPPPPPNGQSTPNLNAPPPIKPPAPPAPPPITAHPNGMDWRTPVGGGLALVGLGAAIAGAVVYQQASADWQSVLNSGGGIPFPPGDSQRVLDAYRSANTKMVLGSAGMIGGAVLAAGGTGLLAWQLLGGPKETQQGTKVACGVSSGAISCSLSFP